MNLCVLSGIRKKFGKTDVLCGVDVAIREGEFAVLVGPSGCGKSTLLRVVSGLEIPDEGEVVLREKVVTRTPTRLRDVAVVFQNYALYPHLTVKDNLAFGLRLRKTPPAEVDARVREAADMLSLSELLHRFPRELSGGQRQRVAMGRALVRRPAIFLFDEPLSNLDAALRAQVRVEIKKLHERLHATSLYVTHDQVEAMTLADTLWVLRDGKVEQSGAPLDVYARPLTKFVASFLGSPTMNFARARVTHRAGEVYVESGVFSFRVTGYREPPREGQEVVVGLRPTSLRLTAPGSNAGAKVTFVEPLGDETLVHLEYEGWVVRAPGELRPAVGESVGLEVAPSEVHLFDVGTERRLL